MQYNHTHDKHAGHDPAMFRQKFWLSLLLTIPTLVFSDSIQSWLGLSLKFAGSEYIPAVFGLVLFLYGGIVFLKGAKAELLSRQPGMMSLISMAISVAFIYSLAVTLKILNGMDFWWELSTLITIMLLGHWLEMASIMNAQGALKELAKLLPDEVELLDGNSTKNIPLSKLKSGDVVLVRPGGKVPADGIVVKGEADANESLLTGESKLVKKVANSNVIGGTIISGGSLTIQIQKTGPNTALAGIMKLVAEAQNSKSKVQVLADKTAYYLTFVAIAAALATAIGWWLAGETAEFILERVVTVLVIACPHALGLAIPLVTAISTTYAAKNGILVRQKIALESARKVDVVLFDKTGTLTLGEQGVVGVVGSDKTKILQIAAAIEKESEHSIAKAIIKYAKNNNVKAPTSSNFSSLAGRGAKATVQGKEFYIGGPNLIEEISAKVSEDVLKTTRQASIDGKTVVFVAESSTVLGAILLADVIRPDSKKAVEDLKQAGKRVAMLTGDSKGVAKWVAEELGIKEYFAEVLPQQKSHIVKTLQKDGAKVAMIGDGVNDAPALAQANVGIAIGAGTDVAIESAGIVLASSNPSNVPKIIKLSKITYRKMQQNIAWAVGYNAVAIPLAAGAMAASGFVLSPAVGAVLMSVSTIIVAANAQLLRKQI